MRRFRNIVILSLAALAAGCIVEQGQVRDGPPVESPPPPPMTADTGVSPDSSYDYAQPAPPAGTDVSSDAVFYDRLSPYGSWTYVAPYGHVWVPAVNYGWRPYYYGRWVLTDWGWTFVSDDPWGWAAYHYGRWNFGVGVGWYWIPGTVWAPAWVSWRYGGGYAAWCPLGPRGVVFGYRHPAWVAVPEQHFTRPITAVAVPAQRTAGVIPSTQPLTGPHATVARSGAFGPPVASVSRATGQPVRPVAAASVVRARPTTTSAPSRAGMQSPLQPRARGDVGRPTPRGGYSPRPGAASGYWPHGAPQGGAPHATPPGGAPHAAPPAGAAPHAAPSGGGHGGDHPHAAGARTK
ncbi:MAG TPA: DUF6600 domain-containing protein [Myxococcales bacterium]|nr:DUF6600 domain-containing protein [Myxococcales bacterium]